MSLKKNSFLHKNKMQKRIIHIICSPHGGLATYVLGILEADTRLDKKLSIFFNSQKSNKNFLLGLNAIKESEKVDFFPFLKTHKLPNLNTIVDICRVYKKLKQYKLRKEILEIYAHGTSAVGISLIVSRLLKIKITYIPHGGLSHLYTKNIFLKSIVYVYDTLLLLANVNFQAESKYTLNIYKNAYKKIPFLNKKISSSYIYSITKETLEKIKKIDFPIPKSDNRKKNKIIYRVIYMGTWRKIKGSLRLLEILKSFEESDFYFDKKREFKFDFYTDIKAIKINSKLPEFINFYPWTNDVYKVLNNSDCQIIPSENESFGYAAIEALLCRIPIIHTNAGGLQEILNSTKMPIIPKYFEKIDIINALKLVTNSEYDKLLNNSQILKEIIKNSYWTKREL